MPDTAQQDLLDVLGGALTPKALIALGKQLGLSLDDVARLAKAVLPALLEQLQHNADKGDSPKIAAAVATDHDGSVLDNAVAFLGGAFLKGSGGGILSHVFGDQIDATAARISDQTHVPAPVVRTAMTALAPLAMGAIAKVAIGAVTAAGVAAILAVAVQGIRSGKVQRVIGNLNDRLDDDGDGNALDDVGRDAVTAVQRGGQAVTGAAQRMAENPAVRQRASKAKSAVTAAAKTGKRKLKKLFGRFGRRG